MTRRASSSRIRTRSKTINIRLTKIEATVAFVVLGLLLLALGYFAARATTPDQLLAWEKNRLETVSGIYNEMKDPPTAAIGGPAKDKAPQK
jgi:hypothetical protein